jgi:hypothetical protein
MRFSLYRIGPRQPAVRGGMKNTGQRESADQQIAD